MIKPAGIAEHMGMPADHLFGDGLHDIAEFERALFLRHPCVVDDLQQQISQFVLKIGKAASRDRVGDLVGFLNGVGGNTAEILP